MSLAIDDLQTYATRDAWNRAARSAASGLPPRRLRTRELTLLSTLATGAPITVIARLMNVSDRTIRRRIRLVCDEIGVSTPIEAVAWAARRQLI